MNWTLVNEGRIYQVTGFLFNRKGYQFRRKIIGYYKTLEEAIAACEKPENIAKVTSNKVIFIKTKDEDKFKKKFLTEFEGKPSGSGFFQIVKVEQVK